MTKRRNPDPTLELLAPDPKVHREEMLDLIAKVFSDSGYFSFRRHCREGYIENSFYDWSASRIGLVDGRIVTHYGVWDYQMRIGSARVRVGGIGVVATHGDYRGKGLMAKTTQACIDAMTQQGYDMTILFGIDNFYHKFGYVPAWQDNSYNLYVRDLPQGPALKLRKRYRLDDPEMVRLGNRAYEGVTGSAVRPTHLVLGTLWKQEIHGWFDVRGRLRGFVRTNPDRGNEHRLIVVDAVGEVGECMSAIAAVARKQGRSELRFLNLPHGSAMASALRQRICRVEINYRPCGGPMIRTLNLRSCLTKMEGELSARVRNSHLAGYTGRLLIVDAREQVVLEIRGGKVRVAEGGKARSVIRGGEHVAQLLIGTDEPTETVRNAGMKLSGDAAMLLPVLFPKEHPILCGADRY